MPVRFLLTSEVASSPRKNPHGAGYDIVALRTVTIPPRSTLKVETGVSVLAPNGFYMQVEDRPLAYLTGVTAARTILDGNYVGQLFVRLFNGGDDSFTFYRGDNIAQVVPRRIYNISVRCLHISTQKRNTRAPAKDPGSAGL